MIKNDNNKERLVIERLCMAGDSTDLSYQLKKAKWYDMSNWDTTYDLSKLLEDGWTIIDTSVSTARCCSQHGYAQKQDHTILILEKTVQE